MKKCGNLFTLVAIIDFLVAAARSFCYGIRNGLVWFALGFTFLCLGASCKTQYKEKTTSRNVEPDRAEQETSD